MLAIGLTAVVLLIICNAFFVAVEFALVAVDRTQVEMQQESGARGASVAVGVLRKLNLHLSGAQFGITLCSLGLGVLAEPVVAPLFEPLLGRAVSESRITGWSVAVALLLTTSVQMVVGELIPKSLAVSKPLTATLRLAGPIRWFTVVVGPVVRACNRVAESLVRGVGITPTEELSATRSREELWHLVRSSGEHGTIEKEEAAMLHRTFRFEEKTAADALTPRAAVRWLPVDATVGDLIDAADATGWSRFPLCRRDLDDVIGVVHAKDVLRVEAGRRRDEPLEPLRRDVAFVPESKSLPALFGQLQSQAGQFAVVVDEYGGTAGIITM
ncbi:MAG: hemolysin family protein, partial [Actinomycetes bacterium]